MDLSLLFPIIILILFIPLFLSSRKQKRQMAAMQALQKALEPGDVVTTTSGLRGTVVDASYEDTIDLEIADGVVTTWIRAAVRDKIVADEPAPAAPAAPAAVAESPAVDGEAPTGTAEKPATVDGTAALDREKDDSPNGSARG